MNYISDNPWPLMLGLIAVALAALLSGAAKGRVVGVCCIVAAIGVFFLEQFLISPGEEVEQQLEVMLSNFKANDVDGISSQISKQNDKLADIAKRGLEMVDVEDSFQIKSAKVIVDDNAENATALVRANGNLTLLKNGGGSRHVPTYWRMTWVPENETWKLRDVARLNPANGQEIAILGAQ